MVKQETKKQSMTTIKSHYGDFKITEEQEMNLRILADYLLAGKLLAEFNMALFDDAGYHGDYTCGSVGCAIGHGPYAGIQRLLGELWTGYAHRVFGLSTHRRDGAAYSYCFSEWWANIDNTPKGAGERILIMLEEGIPAFQL